MPPNAVCNCFQVIFKLMDLLLMPLLMCFLFLFVFSKVKTLFNVESEDLVARPGSPVQLLLY